MEREMEEEEDCSDDEVDMLSLHMAPGPVPSMAAPPSAPSAMFSSAAAGPAPPSAMSAPRMEQKVTMSRKMVSMDEVRKTKARATRKKAYRSSKMS